MIEKGLSQSIPTNSCEPAEIDKPSTSSREVKNNLKDPFVDVETKNQNLFLSGSEKRIQKNFDSFSSQEYAKDGHALILLVSKLLCIFLDLQYFKCEICCNFLQTRICFEDGRGFCFDVIGHCQTCKTDTFLFTT